MLNIMGFEDFYKMSKRKIDARLLEEDAKMVYDSISKVHPNPIFTERDVLFVWQGYECGRAKGFMERGIRDRR